MRCARWAWTATGSDPACASHTRLRHNEPNPRCKPTILYARQDLAVSSGSACTSASLEPSYVLRALGVEEDMAHTSLRFGLGRFTTPAEVDRAVALTVARVEQLRAMSPLWELVQEGVDLRTIQWSQH